MLGYLHYFVVFYNISLLGRLLYICYVFIIVTREYTLQKYT